MTEIIRQYIEDLSVSQASQLHESRLRKMASFYDRVDDKEQVEEAITKAWGVGVKKVAADADGTSGATIETYVHEAFADKVNRGEIDAINTGFVHKICDSKGTLFTEPGGSMALIHETIDNLEEPQKMLERHRRLGGYKATLTAADRFSVFMGSTGVMVAPQRGALRYYQTKPGDVRAFFGDTILEREEGSIEFERRSVDLTRIQDASVVLVRLGKVDVSDYAWIAFVPRNTQEPFGRYIMFSAPDGVTKLPNPGDEGVIDYEIDGTRCNPLTWFSVNNPEYDVPEIPIAIMYGGTTDTKDLFPVTQSLYRLGISLDKKQSHINDKADEKAAGTLAISVAQEAEGKPLPRNLTGAVQLLPGQTIEDIAHDASACEIAHEMLKDTRTEVASSYSVPDFMVSRNKTAIASAESGVSRAIEAQPLGRDRQYREDINQPFVRELFHIEQAYIAFRQWDDESAITLLLECDQVWDSGGLQLPQNTKELVEEIKTAMDGGYMDTIEAIRRYYQLPSDEEAKAFYKRMAERMEEFPPLKKEPDPDPDPMIGSGIQQKTPQPKGSAGNRNGEKP